MDAIGTTLSSRFSAFIGFLKTRIGTNGIVRRGDRPNLPNPIVLLVFAYLNRTRHRLEALFARIEAERASGKGRRIAKPRKKPASLDAQEPTRPKPPAPRKPALPRYFGWITSAVPDTSGCPNLLAQILCDREMEAHIIADKRFGAILRPLCHMLGLDLNMIYGKVPLRPEASPPPDPRYAPWVCLRHPLLPPLPPGTPFRLPEPRKPGFNIFGPPPPPPQQSLTFDQTNDLVRRLFRIGDSSRFFEPADFAIIY